MGMGQRRTTEIARGLFAVRYVGADDSAQPPRVKISAEPDSAAYVDVILHPDHEEAVLSQPGTCLIVRAMMPGSWRSKSSRAEPTAPSRPQSTSSRCSRARPSSAARRPQQPAARRSGGLAVTFGFLGMLPESATSMQMRTNGLRARARLHASKEFRSNGQRNRKASTFAIR